jgi:hypothetical protein
MQNKRGLSAIITTLLIVLLVLVATGVVWGVIRGIIREGTEGIGSSARCLNVDVRATAINCNNPAACIVTLTRTGKNDDPIAGVKLVFFDGTETSGVITKAGNIEKLAGKTLTVDSKLISPNKLEITAYFEDESGNEQTCSQTTSSNIGEGVSSGDISCGDGSCNGVETCLTCEMDCGSCGGEEYCGDGSCNGVETCLTCEMDCGSCGGEEYCGDMIVNLGEECDSNGAANCIDNGQPNECTCESGFIPDPSSNGCIVNPIASCGDGTFDSENEQCDDSDPEVPEDACIEPGEANECTCPDGYNPDGFGGCIAWSPINEGIVEEVWPLDTPMYFASSDLSQEEGDDSLYIGYYVNFPGSAEPDCLIIANYILPFGSYTMSHIAFNSEVNIEIGNSYKIWEELYHCQGS